MKKILLVIAMLIIAAPALATVSVTATDKGSGVVELRYNCSAAEKVRAFALDITVDNGLVISNIRDFNAGESKKPGGGYGIFPAKFADYIDAASPNWADTSYTPVARSTDPNTKSGLGTGAITVELGTLYVGPNSPGTSGLLFRLDVNGSGAPDGNLSIALNNTRGGIVLEDANLAPSPVLTGTKVTFPACINIPAILGDNMTDANSAIRAALLTGTIAITYECNGTYGAGIVCRQDTGCVAASTTINYVVSTGPCCTTIPNIMGMTKADANAALTTAGFTPNGTGSVSCTGTYNTVLTQDTGCYGLPHTVNYTYETGKTDPNIMGMTKAAADAALTTAGFTPNGTGTAVCTGTYNTVLTQDTGCYGLPHTVNYTYETGKTVANEVGVLKATAEAAWTAQGLTLGTATPVVNCAQLGNIVSQGTGCVALPYTINYTYGIAATEPNIVNKTMTDANATIIAAGLTVGTITYEPNGLKAALTVDRQSPAAGTVTCSAVSYVVDTNCLYVGRVFSDPCMATVTITAAQVTRWNSLGQPNCWCCLSQKRGNGIYTGSSATITNALDLAAVKNVANFGTPTTPANACLDFDMNGTINALDLAKVKNVANFGKVTGAGPPCQ